MKSEDLETILNIMGLNPKCDGNHPRMGCFREQLEFGLNYVSRPSSLKGGNTMNIFEKVKALPRGFDLSNPNMPLGLAKVTTDDLKSIVSVIEIAEGVLGRIQEVTKRGHPDWLHNMAAEALKTIRKAKGEE